MVTLIDIISHIKLHGLEGGRFTGEFVDKETGNNLKNQSNTSGTVPANTVVSNPPVGKQKITNIYYNSSTGSIEVEVQP